ncbi:MAG: M48 family metalloprotease [Acidimicrobiales bacterium]|nr:M48 family metalloprotease [Acidimicrobiales bacterium]
MERQHNSSRAWMLLAVAGGTVGVIAWLLLWLVGLGLIWSLLVGLLLAASVAAAVYLGSDGYVLRRVGAAPVGPADEPRLANLVEGLCVARGYHEPRLFVLDDAAPNALAVGRSPRHSALVVTRGLLEQLTRIELEGVIAHELSRIATHDTLLEVHAAVVVGLPLALTPELRRSALRRVIGHQRDVRADLEGVSLTRYPPGLIAALIRVRDHAGAPVAHEGAIGHLWLSPPAELAGNDGLRFTLDDRIAVLQEL